MMANRIKELRQEKHMTQTRLSIELETAQEMISSYECGRCYPSFAVMVRLAQILNTSIDYMMGLSNVRHPQPSDLPQEQAEVLRLYALLNDTQKEKATAYMQGLLDG